MIYQNIQIYSHVKVVAFELLRDKVLRFNTDVYGRTSLIRFCNVPCWRNLTRTIRIKFGIHVSQDTYANQGYVHHLRDVVACS